MKDLVQKWHNDVLALYQVIMFETLIHPHNIVSDSIKAFTFEDENGMETEPLRGYLAMKQTQQKKEKYFIEEEFYDSMPLRVNDYDELYLKESSTKKSVVLRPLDPSPFKITPEQTFPTVKKFIDELAPFEHSNPVDWKLMKICAVMGYVGKTFLGISSPPEFGKSSIYEILHSLTKKSPVFQPRSVPGILVQITGDGNIIFDEVHQSNKETKQCMENFTLQVGGNKPIYINGAMKTTHTKTRYDVSRQSITYLYNTYQNYKNPNDEFFDYLFSNNDAIDSRMLKIRFTGKLTEKFDKDFDLMVCAEINKMYYIKVAKQLLFLKEVKITNSYTRRFDCKSTLNLKGRKKIIYDEITWLIDMYCNHKLEYELMIQTLDKCINSYKEMLKVRYMDEVQETIKPEVVEDANT